MSDMALTIDNLDSARLELRPVDRIQTQVVRPELHYPARLQQGVHESDHGARSRIAIMLRDIVINDQRDRLVPGAVTRTEDALTIRIMVSKHISPPLEELALIDYLISLYLRIRVRTMRDALMVHYCRERRVINFQPLRTHLERQIRVFAVRGQIQLVKSAEPSEQLSRHQETGAGAVVNATDIVEFMLSRILQTAVVPRRPIPPDDAASFLQPSIRVD